MTAKLTPIAAALPATVPFVGPETLERQRGRPFRARLGANESVFGPSPKAVKAMQDASHDAWQYGDPENHDLLHALAAHLAISSDHIMVGEGIDGLLGLVVRLLISPGDAVVTSEGAYPTFNYHSAGFGGVIHKVPYREDHEDPQALLDAARKTGAKLIYFANPDNPMGSWHDSSVVTKMIEGLPDGCLLVLDEAYVELAPPGTALPLQPDDPRVIRMRTFSKSYGLAGARVGYAIGARDLIAAFHRIRNHFGISRVSAAGALAALKDHQWHASVVAEVTAARDRIAQIAHDNGLTPLPSATNFVTLDCGRDGDYARAVLQELIARDVFLRMPAIAPQDRCIRVSCGRAEDLSILAEALPEALKSAAG